MVGVLVWRWGRREILLRSSRQQRNTDQQHRPIQESFAFVAKELPELCTAKLGLYPGGHNR